MKRYTDVRGTGDKRLHTENLELGNHLLFRNCCFAVSRIVLRYVRYAPDRLIIRFGGKDYGCQYRQNDKDPPTTGKRAPHMRIKEKDRMSPIFEEMFSCSGSKSKLKR